MSDVRSKDTVHCTRCGQPLADDNQVWLELSTRTGRYHTEGSVPEQDSQGCFPFGNDCATAVAKANGVNKRIMGAR